MEKPLISVIVPVYNVENYLRRCLDSLLAQTHAAFDAILVDDGSTDASGSICDEYAAKDKRFKVFHTPNGGVSAARNLGLSLADTKYISFVDSDDAVEPDYLELMLSQPDESDLVVMGVKFTTSEGATEKTESYPAARLTINADSSYNVFNNSSFHFAYSKRYKKSILDNGRVTFDTSLSMGEDTLFVLQYLKCCRTVSILENTPYHYYRYGSGTLSSKRLDTYERVDAANAAIAMFLEEWKPGAGSTPAMKRRFWLSFYYASFYTLQYKDSRFGTKLKQLYATFSRTKKMLSSMDIWSMTHMEQPLFRFFLAVRSPLGLLVSYELHRLSRIIKSH